MQKHSTSILLCKIINCSKMSLPLFTCFMEVKLKYVHLKIEVVINTMFMLNLNKYRKLAVKAI